MPEFIADVRDVKFALFEQAGFEKLFACPRYSDLDRETAETILDEAYKFAREQLSPLNALGDEQGSVFDQKTGEIKIPKAFHEPYKLFTENGWLALTHNPEYGGQGMPYSLGLCANDFFFGGCLAFSLQNLLTTGAAHLIEVFGNDELKKTYIEKMYTGVWAGTMCLTESGAGSDVGACRTKARKEGDHYLIEGEKIFISYGEHDLTENICHAVLARVEGAPAGSRGMSLFVVPKYRVNADGSIGDFNDVKCTGIEHKMGIHASPTCTMIFGENGACHGWLLGEENKGLLVMFQMMNEARISVGLQGAALANAAYQQALAYSRERVQGKNLATGKPAVILDHPDVKQMLLWQKAIAEGTRALLIRTAMFFDLGDASEDEAERKKLRGLVELLTPICKAYSSDMGFKSTELAVQTLGGYGYLKEYGVEQYLRDTKIASIYEGTNGIQALDLMGRKLPAEGGANLKMLISMMMELSGQHAKHPMLGKDFELFGKAQEALVEASMYFAKVGGEDRMVPVVNATPYLDLFGQVVLGWLLLEQATIAYPKLEEICKTKNVALDDVSALAELCAENEDARFYQGKVKTAQFWARRMLTTSRAKADILMSGDRTALEVVL